MESTLASAKVSICYYSIYDVPYMLCYILYIICYILYIVCYMLYTIYSKLDMIYYILYVMHYIVYRLYTILGFGLGYVGLRVGRVWGWRSFRKIRRGPTREYIGIAIRRG